MRSIEAMALAWLAPISFGAGSPSANWPERSWLLLLAFTGAVLCVAALRPPCRRLFGAVRACQLWLLPPLAMLASQLPHAPAEGGATLPRLVSSVVWVGGAWPAQAGTAAGLDGARAMAWLWIVGAVAVWTLVGWRQRRYRVRLHGATSIALPGVRWPVLRAASADIGPALVGALQPKIVLPGDFQVRYNAAERVLILAHETMHARRGDGGWCLLAQAIAGVFWFHPLAWWALQALRHDQELACDAAVLREHAGQRRAYAHAMLKTQSAALALPVGCLWSPRHPLTERIAMLKLSAPSRSRRRAGAILGLALLTAASGVVYAASAPLQQRPAPASNAASGYQLDINLELANPAHSHSERARVALCMASGADASVRTHGLEFHTVTVPASSDRVRVELRVATVADGKSLARAQLQGKLGQPMQAQGAGADGQHPYVAYITAQTGCPARQAEATADAGGIPVSVHVVRGNPRDVAASIAAKAGWTLLNPEALSKAPVSLDFEGVPAARAMQLIADVGGVKLRFEGRAVRFEAR